MFLFSMLLMAAQVAPSAPTTAPQDDKVMCRMIQETYSRIPSRICRKNSEWERMARETQDDLKSSRNQRTGEALGSNQH